MEALLPYLREAFANPASAHFAGRVAREAVEHGRAQVAASLGAQPSDVVFTSGATESVNLALQGVARAPGPSRKVVTFAAEHKATLDTCEWLASQGTVVEVLPVGRDGVPDLDVAAQRIDEQTALVSVMAVNNETGVISPIRELVELARRVGALVHCDATQALGKLPFSVLESGIDLVSVSSHKVYGPKGIGALIANRSSRLVLQPLIHGGGHERGLRSGTLNTPGIVGFGQACEIATSELDDDVVRVRRLRDSLEAQLTDGIRGAHVIGGTTARVANTLNVRIPGHDAEALLLEMGNIAASTGSACTAASQAPSHVLRAMGLTYEESLECIRFSLGRFSTQDDVDAVATTLFWTLERERSSEAARG